MDFGDALRAQLAENLARHDRLALPLDGRRHAAVAVVVVDSNDEEHGTDHHPFAKDRMDHIPGGDTYELTGSISGTAGGPAVLLTRRNAKLRARLADNLAAHDRLAFDLEGRRHAAVAVVVVDSDAVLHGDASVCRPTSR